LLELHSSWPSYTDLSNFALASFLDARTKAFKFAPDSEAANYLKIATNKLKTLLLFELQSSLPQHDDEFEAESPDTLPPLNAPPLTDEDLDYQDMADATGDVINLSPVDKIIAKWNAVHPVGFRKNNVYNLSVYDNQHPALARIALSYQAVPATSASTERLFSLMNRIDWHTNSRLTKENWRYLAFLRANPELLDQIQ